MARKNDIQYIRYYTQGSTARVLEPQEPAKRPAPRPRVRKVKKKLVHVDPLAIGGIVVAAVMLVLMVVGSVRLHNSQQKQQVMEEYVDSLTAQNASLANEYENGYDLEEVEEAALALGMIPVSEAQHITIPAYQEEAPVPQEKPSAWESFWAFLAGLFA